MSVLYRRVSTGGKDRTQGEEIRLRGNELRVRTSYSHNTQSLFEISLTGAGGHRIPLVDGVIRTPFDTVWLFHGPAGSRSAPIELWAADGCDTFEPARPDVRPTLFATVDSITAAGLTQILAADPLLRYRVLAYRFELTANASQAAAGRQTIELQSPTLGLLPISRHVLYLPAAPAANAIGSLDTGWIDLTDKGIVSWANNAINVNLLNALATGELLVSLRYALEPV